MSTSAAENANSFDYFLYGMAMANHSTCLHSTWKSGDGCKKVVTYLAGMGEHLLYMICKAIAAIAFIFLIIGLAIHYLAAKIQKEDESEIIKRKIRLLVGILVFTETFPGICIDTLGVLCPPMAYQAHSFFKQQITRRCFEKWGIVDHTMSQEKFDSLNYFGKI